MDRFPINHGLLPEVYPQDDQSRVLGTPIVLAPLIPAVFTLCGAEAVSGAGMAPSNPAGPPSAVEVVRSLD